MGSLKLHEKGDFLFLGNGLLHQLDSEEHVELCLGISFSALDFDVHAKSSGFGASFNAKEIEINDGVEEREGGLAEFG
jgi:hypothetical protein